MPQTPKRLAIHPYPEQYTRRPRLRDGTQVTVRPIRPVDEPLWHELIASSSSESIRFRFRSILRQTNHQMAVKYCTIDYERELAMVVEVREEDRRRLPDNRSPWSILNRTSRHIRLLPEQLQVRGGL
jgi:acetyltransferase